MTIQEITNENWDGTTSVYVIEEELQARQEAQSL